VTRVVISPIANRELEEIWLTIGVSNPRAATRIVRAIGAKIDLLRKFPRLGPMRPEFFPSTRLLIEGHYLILYETQPNTIDGPIDVVEIVRIVDGRQDLKRLFQSISRGASKDDPRTR
jgi:toxin ParE1/3/4